MSTSVPIPIQRLSTEKTFCNSGNTGIRQDSSMSCKTKTIQNAVYSGLWRYPGDMLMLLLHVAEPFI